MCIGIHWPNVYCKHVREKKGVPISLAPGLHAYLSSMCAGGGGGWGYVFSKLKTAQVSSV